MSRRILAAVLALGLATPAAAEEVVVFAAASMKTALDKVAEEFQAATGNTVTISYAGSNALAKQIIEGAPADIFVSAAVNWMDEVEKAGLVVKTVQSVMPPKTSYELTEAGRALRPTIDAIETWAEKFGLACEPAKEDAA